MMLRLFMRSLVARHLSSKFHVLRPGARAEQDYEYPQLQLFRVLELI
jgi:hypothetical protein